MASHFRPFWLTAEQEEWVGLWKRNCFKVWKRSDLAADDRVFTSRYVYKLKRDAISGKVSRFKTRLIGQGFKMQQDVDYNDTFRHQPHTGQYSHSDHIYIYIPATLIEIYIHITCMHLICAILLYLHLIRARIYLYIHLFHLKIYLYMHLTQFMQSLNIFFLYIRYCGGSGTSQRRLYTGIHSGRSPTRGRQWPILHLAPSRLSTRQHL